MWVLGLTNPLREVEVEPMNERDELSTAGNQSAQPGRRA
jgi:hypothetical protein